MLCWLTWRGGLLHGICQPYGACVGSDLQGCRLLVLSGVLDSGVVMRVS